MANPVKKQQGKSVAHGANDFAVRKFLLRAELLEQKQKLLGKKIDELLKNIKLKSVYHKILSQD